MASINGQSVAVIPVPLTMLVSELKDAIQAKEGTPKAQQQLLRPGDFSKLDDTRCIAELGELGDTLDLILVRLANFFPSEKFDGVKQGYAFKMGEDGLGYYHDEYQDGEGSSRDGWDGLWVPAAGTSSVIIERGKIYLGNSGIIRDSRTSGVADFERIDDKRFALDCSEGLLTATLVDFQHLEWEPRGQAVVPSPWTRSM